MALDLSPDKARIFRIVHRDNLPWIFEHGLHASTGDVRCPNYRDIGHTEVIARRQHRKVKVHPGGTLSDYVPFYFTPCSIMLLNIVTGYNGVKKVPREEIVVLVSSLLKLAELGVPFVFTNQHALSGMAEHHNDLSRLDLIDWELLRRLDFSHDNEDPGKTLRYQAEALAWKHVPLRAILGLGCHSETVERDIRVLLDGRGLQIPTAVRPRWYFP